MKSSKFMGKVEKIKAKWTQVSLKMFYNIARVLAPYKSYWASLNKIFIYARPCVNKMTWAFFSPGFRVSLATCEYFRLYFCCLLDQDLKGQCRWKNWQVLRWFLPYFKEKEKCIAAYQDRNSEARLKKCSRHLIYARACVNKDFVHSGSVGHI